MFLGLYGCPLDTDLFDVDSPPLRTAPASVVVAGPSYAGIVASNLGPGGGVTVGVGPGGGPIGAGGVSSSASNMAAGSQLNHDDVVFKDLMNLCWTDGGGLSVTNKAGAGTPEVLTAHYLNGLLEVEPLHFICHATSDGTRMERLDSGNCRLFLYL
jgi:baculoviral IAP repeat-containing protein 6